MISAGQFDPKTAKPLKTSFDPTSARPVISNIPLLPAGHEPIDVPTGKLSGMDIIKAVGGGLESVALPIKRGITFGQIGRLEDLASYIASSMLGKPESATDITKKRMQKEDELREKFVPGGRLGSEIAEVVTSLPAFIAGGSALRALPLIGEAAFAGKGVLPVLGRNLLAPSIRGGIQGLVSLAGEPEVKPTFGTTAFATGLGAAIETTPPLIAKGSKLGFKALSEIGQAIPLIETPIKKAEQFAEWLFSGRGRKILSNVGAKEPEIAGRESIEELEKLSSESFKKYKIALDPIRKEIGEKTISPQRLRNAYLDKLKEADLVDEKGNIVEDSLELLFESDLRPTFKKLHEQLIGLGPNPTWGQMEKIIEKIGKIAKFNKGIRSDKDRIFGTLYHEARENLLEGAEEIGGKGIRDSVDQARKALRAERIIFEGEKGKGGEIGKLMKMREEEAIERAGTTGRLDQPEIVNEALEAIPESKPVMKKIVLSDISRRTKDDKSFAKAVNLYQKTLPLLLEPEEYTMFMRALSGEVMPPFINKGVKQGTRAVGQAVLKQVIPDFSEAQTVQHIFNEE